jgi:hypothetical protein
MPKAVISPKSLIEGGCGVQCPANPFVKTGCEFNAQQTLRISPKSLIEGGCGVQCPANPFVKTGCEFNAQQTLRISNWRTFRLKICIKSVNFYHEVDTPAKLDHWAIMASGKRRSKQLYNSTLEEFLEQSPQSQIFMKNFRSGARKAKFSEELPEQSPQSQIFGRVAGAVSSRRFKSESDNLRPANNKVFGSTYIRTRDNYNSQFPCDSGSCQLNFAGNICQWGAV